MSPDRDNRSQPDYDGQDDYLAEAAATPTRGPLASNPFDFLISLGFAITATRGFAVLSASGHARDAISHGFSVVLVFVVALIGCWAFLSRVSLSEGARRAAYLALVATVVFGLALPLYRTWKAAEEAHTAESQAMSRLSEAQERLKVRWLADLEAAGAHGPQGTEPPMLRVDDRGATLSITNLSDNTIHCTLIRRVPQYESIERGSPENCAMLARVHGSLYGCMPLAPGETQEFELGDSAGKECAALPLEFRVGDALHPEPSWWSDSALRELRGQMRPRSEGPRQ